MSVPRHLKVGFHREALSPETQVTLTAIGDLMSNILRFRLERDTGRFSPALTQTGLGTVSVHQYRSFSETGQPDRSQAHFSVEL